MKILTKNKGFTLIELMIVIVIIGLLISIALPNMIAAQDRAKMSAVKSNMKTLKVVVEVYAVDWGGVYPTSINELYDDAIDKVYWQEIRNPVTGLNGLDKSYDGITAATSVSNNDNSQNSSDRGIVYYKAASDDNSTYAVYGRDNLGKYIRNSNRIFFLTNN